MILWSCVIYAFLIKKKVHNYDNYYYIADIQYRMSAILIECIRISEYPSYHSVGNLFKKKFFIRNTFLITK